MTLIIYRGIGYCGDWVQVEIINDWGGKNNKHKDKRKKQ